jgi:hypothetical protein
MKTTLMLLQNLANFKSDRMEYMEQLSIWTQVQIRNRIRTKIPRNKTTFEFGPNLLGVQTGLEKSDKISKILICIVLQDCEFRLASLYGKI